MFLLQKIIIELSLITKKIAPRLTKNEGQTNQTNQTYLTKLKLTLLAASEFPPTKTSNKPGSATNFKSEL